MNNTQLITPDYHNVRAAELTEPEGVVKRLAAAMHSATKRGDVQWWMGLVQQSTEPNAIHDQKDDLVVTFSVVVFSDGGVWSSRAYWLEGQVTLRQDCFGVHEVWTEDASAVVVAKDGTSASAFIGEGADVVLKRVVMECVLRDRAFTTLMPSAYSGEVGMPVGLAWGEKHGLLFPEHWEIELMLPVQ